jgi:hypothetical protein
MSESGYTESNHTDQRFVTVLIIKKNNHSHLHKHSYPHIFLQDQLTVKTFTTQLDESVAGHKHFFNTTGHFEKIIKT